MQDVITTATPVGLGFNPFSAVKAVAKGVARVATNPNVQRAATTAAAAYAPGQYAQAQQYANQARGVYRTVIGPGGRPMPVPVQMPAPPMSAVEESDMHPTKGGGVMTYALIGAGLLVVLLLVKK